jgi:hypothetical protein
MHLVKDEISSLFAVIKCPLKDFKIRGLMTVCIKPAVVA